MTIFSHGCNLEKEILTSASVFGGVSIVLYITGTVLHSTINLDMACYGALHISGRMLSSEGHTLRCYNATQPYIVIYSKIRVC